MLSLMRNVAFLGLAGAAVLAAEAAPRTEPLTANLFLAATQAEGEFRDEMGGKWGLGVGFAFTTPLSARFALRPAIQLRYFPTLDHSYRYKTNRYSDRGDEESRWSTWSCGADVIFRPAGPTGRFYAMAGGYVMAWKLHSFGTFTTSDAYNPTRSYSVDDTSTHNQPAVAMGLGFTCNRHLSLETRAVFADYRGLSYNTLEAMVVLSY
jgi:hypothetical protein